MVIKINGLLFIMLLIILYHNLDLKKIVNYSTKLKFNQFYLVENKDKCLSQDIIMLDQMTNVLIQWYIKTKLVMEYILLLIFLHV